MPKRSSPSLLSAAHLEAMTDSRSYASLPAFKQIRRLPTASSDFSLSDSEDDDDDDTSSVLSSCGSSASDESLISCASSRAVPDVGDHCVVKRQHSYDKGFNGDASSTYADSASPAPFKDSPAQVQYKIGLGQLPPLGVPTTNDLEEALRSNGRLAYVTDAGSQKPAALQAGKPAATPLPSLPHLLPTGQSWGYDSHPGDPVLAACPCFMCQPPACSLPPGLTAKGGSVGLAPPGSPGSYDSEECTFRGPIPSSLAIAAALAAGDMPSFARSEQQAMPPVTCMLPMSYSAALLMAAPFTPQPGPPCPTAMPPPWRPLDLPLSSPSLVGAPAVLLGLQQ